MIVDDEGFVQVSVDGTMQRRRAYRDCTVCGGAGMPRIVPETEANEMLVEMIGCDPVIVRISD